MNMAELGLDHSTIPSMSAEESMDATGGSFFMNDQTPSSLQIYSPGETESLPKADTTANEIESDGDALSTLLMLSKANTDASHFGTEVAKDNSDMDHSRKVRALLHSNIITAIFFKT